VRTIVSCAPLAGGVSALIAETSLMQRTPLKAGEVDTGWLAYHRATSSVGLQRSFPERMRIAGQTGILAVGGRVREWSRGWSEAGPDPHRDREWPTEARPCRDVGGDRKSCQSGRLRLV